MENSANSQREAAHKVIAYAAGQIGWANDEDWLTASEGMRETLRNARKSGVGAVEILATKLDSDPSRFILELIQNAEDNHFMRVQALDEDPSISFSLRPGKIVVDCNEDGFTEANVIAICKTGGSTKTFNNNYIGEKGIGFKAVFKVASKVHIQSNWFSFSFKYNGTQDPKDKLGMIIPRVEEADPPGPHPLTKMTLTTRADLEYATLVTQFEAIPPNILLFLSTLKTIKVDILPSVNALSYKTTTFRKIEEPIRSLLGSSSVSPQRKTFKVRRETNYSFTRGPDDTNYLVFTRQLTNLAEDNARPGDNECEVTLAFPFDVLDEPVTVTPQYVFAYLPIREADISFSIQADFILQANRQEIEKSSRNHDILIGAAKVFRDAVLHFCSLSTDLRFRWIRYLPSFTLRDAFFSKLPQEISNALQDLAVVYSDSSADPCSPKQLRTLRPKCLDIDGKPLFRDLPTAPIYLSQKYTTEEVEILREVFALKAISVDEIVSRIQQDLTSPRSRIKSRPLNGHWHSRTSALISAVLDKSAIYVWSLKTLDLIPLVDGRWVNGLSPDLVFPSENEPPIPQDIIVTVHPEACVERPKKETLKKLGVKEIKSEEVVRRLWAIHLTEKRILSLASSVEHMRYLFINDRQATHSGYTRLWLYDQDMNKVTPRQKLLYLQSQDKFGPQELLKAVPCTVFGERNIPECKVPYINLAYLIDIPMLSGPNAETWLQWLEKNLGVQRAPRLKLHTGSLSQEFRHIMAYRPEELLGTLKEYWSTYAAEMSENIIRDLSNATMRCEGTPGYAQILNQCYMPSPKLKEKVVEFGDPKPFPFLQLPPDNESIRSWDFLEKLGVCFEADLQFYVDILRYYRLQRDSEEIEVAVVLPQVLKLYERIASLCEHKDREELRETFNEDSILLGPDTCKADAKSLRWTSPDLCVWEGPGNILGIPSLASIPEYRQNKKIASFFVEDLGMRDVELRDYTGTLVSLQDFEVFDDVSQTIIEIYLSISSSNFTNEEWSMLRHEFEEKNLIYYPEDGKWYGPSECLWSSPIKVNGKAILDNVYLEDVRPLFLNRLGVASASLKTLVDELQSICGNGTTSKTATEIIWAINGMKPKIGDLEKLSASRCLPLRKHVGSHPRSFLGSSHADFFINDRRQLGEIFADSADFLDFDQEQVQNLRPFLQALNLEPKYLSNICTHSTQCNDDGVLDEDLTTALNARAHDILRCAAFYQSPYITNRYNWLFRKLQSATIRRTSRISTRYTLTFPAKEVTSQIQGGLFHQRERNEKWEFFVPANQMERERCYMKHFPDALASLMQISPTAREIIGNVLRSSLSVMDDLLDDAGIGPFSKVSPLPRVIPEILSSEHTSIVDPSETSDGPRSAVFRFTGTLGPQTPGNRAQRNLDNVRSASPMFPFRSAASPVPAARSRESSSLTLHAAEDSEPGDAPLGSVASWGSNLFGDTVTIFPGAIDAYRTVLENVIQVARLTRVQHKTAQHSLFDISGNSPLPGFDHQLAFGIRAQDSFLHNTKIGAAGELFVYEVLKGLLGDEMNLNNWQSRTRDQVSIHPNYHGLTAWPENETADIVFDDSAKGSLTKVLIEKGYLDGQVWRDARPEYLLEVKTTTGELENSFFMNGLQYTMMQNLALQEGTASSKVYIILRVYNLGKSNMQMRIYVDPEVYRRDQQLTFSTNKWTVTPRR